MKLMGDQEAVDRSVQISGHLVSFTLEFEDIEESTYPVAPGKNNIPHCILLHDNFEVLFFQKIMAAMK